MRQSSWVGGKLLVRDWDYCDTVIKCLVWDKGACRPARTPGISTNTTLKREGARSWGTCLCLRIKLRILTFLHMFWCLLSFKLSIYLSILTTSVVLGVHTYYQSSTSTSLLVPVQVLVGIHGRCGLLLHFAHLVWSSSFSYERLISSHGDSSITVWSLSCPLGTKI